MDFLGTLTAGMGQATGAGLMNLITGWATGGFKGRPQWRDLEFMNDAQNRLWPDEIQRQGDFLEGLAPSQAAAYNTQQDATFGQDTQRQIGRVKDMSSALGMSPWEITGAGGANPLPSPSGGGQQGQSSLPQFLQALIPLEINKQNNATNMSIAKMQNDTAQRGQDVGAETSRYGIDQAQGGGNLAKSQIAQIASTINLQDVQHSNGIRDLDLKQQQEVIGWMQAVLQAMPKDTLQLPGYTSTMTPGWQNVMKKFMEGQQRYAGDASSMQRALDALPPDDWNAVKQAIIETAKTGTGILNEGIGAVGRFLSGQK